MGIDEKKLKEVMKQKNMTQYQLADAIGVDNSTFIRKMKRGGESFTVGQLHKMADVLCMDKVQAADIFLPINSQ